jgi:hypothetical protein
MYQGGVKMAGGDNPAIWIAQMHHHLNSNPLISPEVVIRAVLKDQVSRELKDIDPPSPEESKDIGLFVRHMLSRQSTKEKWDNHLALVRLFKGIHQVVGPKKRDDRQQTAFEYVETIASFIRRVRRLADILHPPPLESSQRDLLVYEAVILGLHPKWRDGLFALANRSTRLRFPAEDLTMDALKELADQIDLRPEYRGAKAITFELTPETRYRAEVVGGSRFSLPIFNELTHYDRDVGGTGKPATGRDSSSGKGSSSGRAVFSASASAVHPPSPTKGSGGKKTEWVWEERKNDPCTFCLKQTGHKHKYGACPNRDPVTGDILKGKDPRKDDEKNQEGHQDKKHRPNK